jgi:hypothetical protein
MSARIPMGTYRLWIARLIRWGIARRLPEGVTILLRGRGPKHGYRYTYSLPLEHAKRATLYLIDNREALASTKRERVKSERRLQQYRDSLARERERLTQIEQRDPLPSWKSDPPNHPLNAWEHTNNLVDPELQEGQ